VPGGPAAGAALSRAPPGPVRAVSAGADVAAAGGGGGGGGGMTCPWPPRGPPRWAKALHNNADAKNTPSVATTIDKRRSITRAICERAAPRR
jgi:hypothetical protein